jgi:hypothetical protein
MDLGIPMDGGGDKCSKQQPNDVCSGWLQFNTAFAAAIDKPLRTMLSLCGRLQLTEDSASWPTACCCSPWIWQRISAVGPLHSA